MYICISLSRTPAIHCNLLLQLIATYYYNTLQLTATTLCNSCTTAFVLLPVLLSDILQLIATRCYLPLQHTATDYYNSLQFSATNYCNSL